MADYNSENISGRRFTRWSRVVIENPYNSIPTVNCIEQNVYQLPTGDMLVDRGNLGFTFDPSFSFPVFDPVTGVQTPFTETGEKVYMLIYSYILAKAKERDAANATS